MKTKDIAQALEGRLTGSGETEVFGVAALDAAKETEISFVENASAAKEAARTKAACLIVPAGFAAEFPSIPRPLIEVKNPKLAFARIAAVLHPPKRRLPEIHPSAVIAETAEIAPDVFVGAFCCVGEHSRIGAGTQLRAGAKVGDNVEIGSRCVLHPNVFVEDDCRIGAGVILHAGVIIGADGFGFVRGDDGYIKFPQIGTVVIEDDVEIGANSCVDRGALGETRIGRGAKIDNLVQIAHNVQIGQRVVIAAQTGISGSTIIEDDCVIGGQVGMGDHARVKSGAVIGSQAGVLPGKIVRPGVWWGTPVQPLDEYKRQNAMVKGLKRLREEVRELKNKVFEKDD
ncbi:MAG: UDP-3-O-(3-hydroxymyristoyl)glucosamine N-acyltransferase [Pyrinomonadaceae bacterium]